VKNFFKETYKEGYLPEKEYKKVLTESNLLLQMIKKCDEKLKKQKKILLY
jgi:hypothetical protein